MKRLRVDLLTSCAKVLREATGFKPQFLVGLGQGGLVAAVLRWALVVGLALLAGDLQRKEARAAGEAIWVLRPRLWRTQCGHQEIAESCPELQREFPEPPLRGFGVVGKIAAGDEVLRLLRLDPSKGIEEASIRGMLEEPLREMWDHDGVLPMPCLHRAGGARHCCRDRRKGGPRGPSPDRDPESAELGVEVNGVLAARERAGGVLEVPSSAVQSWAASFLQAPRDEAVPTLFGSLRGKLWKGGSHLTLSRGTSTDQLKYITAWVVREGVVVLGHNSSPVGVVLSWSVEPNWHGHRHLVNAVCESLWRASGQEVALDPAFDRLLCLIGKPRRVEGWFDSEGEACIAHRRGLRKQGVLATFTCLGEGHWTSSPLSAKIVVDESKKARTLCFVGDLHREQCVVLELLTQHLVLTKWDHLASKVRVKVDPKSFAYPMEVSADDLRREQLAIQARDAAGVSEFRVTGSIRTAWYEAQRRDPSLTAALIRSPRHPWCSPLTVSLRETLV